MVQFNLQLPGKIGRSALAQILPGGVLVSKGKRSFATIGDSMTAFLTRFMKGNRKTEDEKKETPDSPSFIHFDTMRLKKELPAALFHLFDRSGLRAWGDEYALIVAQAAELGIDLKSADTLITKTENSGVTFFFGDGWVWVEFGQLGMELLQKGKN